MRITHCKAVTLKDFMTNWLDNALNVKPSYNTHNTLI